MADCCPTRLTAVDPEQPRDLVVPKDRFEADKSLLPDRWPDPGRCLWAEGLVVAGMTSLYHLPAPLGLPFGAGLLIN